MSYRYCVRVGALAAVVSSAQAQWTVTNLHPAGTTSSVAYAVNGSQQAGYARGLDGFVHASLWSGTAASWVNLTPAGGTESHAYAISGSQQAGRARVGGVFRAGLWSGTAASWVDLHPAATGVAGSVVHAMSGTQQAGYTLFTPAISRASVWSGTAASWVDLNPNGATQSRATGTNGSQQAGWANVGGIAQASLWSGTAASWVSLHPAATEWSVANAMNGSQQAGFAVVGGMDHASLWSGTAASWVDLHPTGWAESYVHAMSGSYQAGHVFSSNVNRASLWSGTAASWLNLHAFLPTSFTNSFARAVWTDGINIYVGGEGFHGQAGRWEALLWTRPVPAPGAAALLGLGGVLAARRRRTA